MDKLSVYDLIDVEAILGEIRELSEEAQRMVYKKIGKIILLRSVRR